MLNFLSLSGGDIKQLSLSNNKITSKGCMLISEYLAERDNFKHLDLSYNSIGLEGLEMITALLRIKPAIRTLNFNSCDIKTD